MREQVARTSAARLVVTVEVFLLGQTDRPLTNRELAGRLSVDPGHLHFHVRNLRAGGIY